MSQKNIRNTVLRVLKLNLQVLWLRWFLVKKKTKTEPFKKYVKTNQYLVPTSSAVQYAHNSSLTTGWIAISSDFNQQSGSAILERGSRQPHSTACCALRRENAAWQPT